MTECSHLLDYIEEATDIVKRELGDEYHFTDENSFTSLWANYKSCQFVEDEGNPLLQNLDELPLML